MATITASQLQGIINRYNTKHTAILQKQLGQQTIPAEAMDVITSMLADMNVLITAINADDALGVVVVGYGVAPVINNHVSAVYNSNAPVSLSVVSAFKSPTAITGYSVATGSTLPAWLTLNTSTGVLTGTVPLIKSSTTIKFNITATNAFGSATNTVSILLG